jgi:hypothetical protein
LLVSLQRGLYFMRRLLMRVFGAIGATALALVVVAWAQVPADEVTSGVKVGGSVGSYSGTKAGGIEDGVGVGKAICYT